MNRFLYAHANPATLIDPTGHAALEYDDARTGQTVYRTPGGSTHVVSHPDPKTKATSTELNRGQGTSPSPPVQSTPSVGEIAANFATYVDTAIKSATLAATPRPRRMGDTRGQCFTAQAQVGVMGGIGLLGKDAQPIQ